MAYRDSGGGLTDMLIGVDGIVTTEKDMVKLNSLNIDHLPIRALRIEMKIWEEEAFFKRIISLF